MKKKKQKQNQTPKSKQLKFFIKTEIYGLAPKVKKDKYWYIAERVANGLFNINLGKKEENLNMEKAIHELLVLKNEIINELEIRISEAAAKIREDAQVDLIKIEQALEILGYQPEPEVIEDNEPEIEAVEEVAVEEPAIE